MVMLGILALGILPAAPSPVTPAGFSAIEPQAASVGGKVFVTCGSGDRVFFIRSDDGGHSYGLPVKLPTTGHLSLGMRRGPRIAATNRVIVISAVYAREGGGKDGDLVAWRSTDGGRIWQGPTRVNDAPNAAREGLHAMSASSDGLFACAWLDDRAGGKEVWESTSSDAGATWSKNVRVYHSPDGHVCECCHPSIALGPKGEEYVMFRNWLGGSRDMYLSKSIDGGRSFSDAQKLGKGTWPLNACPMDGGAIAVMPDGSVVTAWRRDGHVFLCRPGQGEADLGEGTQPWIATTAVGTDAVWQQGGQVRWPRISAAESLGPGNDPMVISVKGHGLAVWADPDGRIWSQSESHP